MARLDMITNSTSLMFQSPVVALDGTALIEEYAKYLEWFSCLPKQLAKIAGAPAHVLTMQ